MVSLIGLPSYNPGNALNFQPLNDAIDGNRQNALAQQQMGLQQQRNALMMKQDERAGEMHGVQMAQARTQQEMQEARMAAGRVQGIMQLPAEQRAAAWAAARKMPGFRDLPAEFDNFDHAAPLLLGKAREYIGEKDQAAIGLTRAQTAAAYAQADKARREAADGGKASLVPVWGKDAQGNDVILQTRPDGTAVQTRLPPGVSPNPGGTSRVDLGTEWGVLDRSGQLIGRVRKDVAGKAEQTKLGEWEGAAPQRTEGKKRLDTALAGLAQDYMALDKSGGIVNPDKGTMDNVAARARSSGLGQAVAGATGAKEQSIRQRINNARPLLINGIREATGMSARAMDSNKELEFYLQAVSDPKSDLHSNLVAIDVLDKTYGLGGVLQRSIPKELYERVSRDAQRQMQARPIPKDVPDGAGSFSPPAQSGWSIQRVD